MMHMRIDFPNIIEITVRHRLLRRELPITVQQLVQMEPRLQHLQPLITIRLHRPTSQQMRQLMKILIKLLQKNIKKYLSSYGADLVNKWGGKCGIIVERFSQAPERMA